MHSRAALAWCRHSHVLSQITVQWHQSAARGIRRNQSGSSFAQMVPFHPVTSQHVVEKADQAADWMALMAAEDVCKQEMFLRFSAMIFQPCPSDL